MTVRGLYCDCKECYWQERICSEIRFITSIFHNNLLVMLSPLKSPVLRKYSNPFKRPGMYPSISKCNAKKGYRYHKLRKTFSKFYRRHYELVSKFSVGLKTLLHQGLSEPEFYGDLVYKFKKIVGRADFSDQFRKIIVRYKRIGYNINIMRQSACLVFNPITVNNFASLFICTPVGRASDSMMAPT